MKLEFLCVLLCSVAAVLAVPVPDSQGKGPLSLSFSSKELFETLGLEGISVSPCAVGLSIEYCVDADDSRAMMTTTVIEGEKVRGCCV